MSRFQRVDDHQDTFRVKLLCQVLELILRMVRCSPRRAARQQADESLAARVQRAQNGKDVGDPAYGLPRVTSELHYGMPESDRVNHKSVARVMREYGLAGIRLSRKVKSTIPEPADQKVADLIRRDFTAETINTRYVGDITYLTLGDGKNRYLATVIDLHPRKLAGWAPADSYAYRTRTQRVTSGSGDPRVTSKSHISLGSRVCLYVESLRPAVCRAGRDTGDASGRVVG